MKEDPQLVFWKGDFGKQYLKRNSLNSEKINESEKVFKRILGGLQLNSILEVGSNVGINLSGIRRAFGKNIDLYAVEPFEEAYRQLLSNQEINLKEALNCSAFEIPFEDNSIDYIEAIDLFEHILYPTFPMNECWRVLKDGGTLYIEVPYGGTEDYYKDPTHVRPFIPKTFKYFAEWNTSPAYELKKWEILAMKSTLGGENQNRIFVSMRPVKDQTLDTDTH